jgi:hypothetical protein
MMAAVYVANQTVIDKVEDEFEEAAKALYGCFGVYT